MRRPPRWLRCASPPAGRADLLAEACVVMEAASGGQLHEPLARQAAEPCRKASADPEAIPRWIAEGSRAGGGMPRGGRRSLAACTTGERCAAPVLREVHRERGMRVCFFVEEPAGRDLPGAGDLIARREITEAEQQRLDRYKRRRDEYLRKLAHLAPPLSEEQKARLAPRWRNTGARRRLDVQASGRRSGRRPERTYVRAWRRPA